MTRKMYENIKEKKKGRNTTVKVAEIPVHTPLFAILSFFSTLLLPSTIIRLMSSICKLGKWIFE
jgi:hypothetical protein